jgi:hypothetical protein
MQKEPGVCCAYLVTNLHNGKRYVGIIATSGKTINKRWREHCYEASYDSKKLLHRAIRKYGETAFRVEVIACARALADTQAVERVLIAQRLQPDRRRRGRMEPRRGNAGKAAGCRPCARHIARDARARLGGEYRIQADDKNSASA